MTGAVASAPAPGDGFPDGTRVVAVVDIFEHGYDDGEPLALAGARGVVIGQCTAFPGEIVTVRFENGRASDVRTTLYQPPSQTEVRRADAPAPDEERGP